MPKQYSEGCATSIRSLVRDQNRPAENGQLAKNGQTEIFADDRGNVWNDADADDYDVCIEDAAVE
jgi:hypothetical protein